MTEKTAKNIRLLYGAVLSAAAVLSGICLIGACLDIYRSGGEQIYTPEKVAAAFSGIAVPVWLFLALTVGGILLELLLPPRPKTKNPGAEPEMVRDRLLSKADMTYCGPQLRAAIDAQRKKRCLVTAIGFAILAVGTVIFLIYALNGSHFHQTDVTGSMVSAMAWMLPCLAVPFGYAVFAAYFCKKSIREECELLKTVPKAPAEAKPARAAAWESWLRWGLLGVAAVILVYGYLAGGTVDVLTKAVNICTECVGLG